ncbi:MAG: DUF2189 domain-containing protein, partial [Rhodospirillales bacterium]
MGEKIRPAGYNHARLRVAARRDQRPERALSVTFGGATAGTGGSGGLTMGNENSIANAGAFRSAQPIVHKIGPADLKDVLVKGIADFNAMPTHGIFLCLIYPIVVVIAARIHAGYDVLPLIFPLLAGYSLLGPVVATGMYELSRRREKGLDTSRRKAFHVLQRHATRSVGALGAVLVAIYLAWLVTALSLWEKNFGDVAPESIQEFATLVVLTADGWE